MSDRKPRVKRVKLVEQYTGVGELRWQDRSFDRVPYRISRYQGVTAGGMPVPGVHRIEGQIEIDAVDDAPRLVGSNVTLALEDGRTLALTLADAEGRVLAEGHGPEHGCSCC